MNWCVLQPEPIVLYEAAKAGKLDEVEAAVGAGAEMEWANPDEFGYRAVHAASQRGHKDVVAFLASRGADVNAVDDTQWTPLHMAACEGKASVCTTLLALKADPAAKTKHGYTALQAMYPLGAMDGNKTECVEVLEAAMRRHRLKLPPTATDAECEQAQEVASKKVPEALAAVAAAVESGDRTKVAAAQRALEEVAAADGVAVSVSFRSARVRSKQTGWNSCHYHVSFSEAAQLLPLFARLFFQKKRTPHSCCPPARRLKRKALPRMNNG
jgi:hypothetical protein